MSVTRAQSLDELSTPDRDTNALNVSVQEPLEYQYSKTVATRGDRNIDKITSLANLEPGTSQPVLGGPSQQEHLAAREALRNPGSSRRTNRGASRTLAKSNRRPRSIERSSFDPRERNKRTATSKFPSTLFPPVTKQLKK